MKPFNLEEAKAGKPVCTKDGRKVRLFCFDRKTNNRHKCKIVGLVEFCEGHENVETWDIDGKYLESSQSDDDLFMAPVKREGWVNIFKHSNIENDRYCNLVFETREKAIESKMAINRVATVKIEWEE